MKETCTERQIKQAKEYFWKKGGVITDERYHHDGLYHFVVYINGGNPSFRIENGILYWLEFKNGHWNWKSILVLDKKSDKKKESRLGELEVAIHKK